MNNSNVKKIMLLLLATSLVIDVQSQGRKPNDDQKNTATQALRASANRRRRVNGNQAAVPTQIAPTVSTKARLDEKDEKKESKEEKKSSHSDNSSGSSSSSSISPTTRPEDFDDFNKEYDLKNALIASAQCYSDPRGRVLSGPSSSSSSSSSSSFRVENGSSSSSSPSLSSSSSSSVSSSSLEEKRIKLLKETSGFFKALDSFKKSQKQKPSLEDLMNVLDFKNSIEKKAFFDALEFIAKEKESKIVQTPWQVGVKFARVQLAATDEKSLVSLLQDADYLDIPELMIAAALCLAKQQKTFLNKFKSLFKSRGGNDLGKGLNELLAAAKCVCENKDATAYQNLCADWWMPYGVTCRIDEKDSIQSSLLEKYTHTNPVLKSCLDAMPKCRLKNELVIRVIRENCTQIDFTLSDWYNLLPEGPGEDTVRDGAIALLNAKAREIVLEGEVDKAAVKVAVEKLPDCYVKLEAMRLYQWKYSGEMIEGLNAATIVVTINSIDVKNSIDLSNMNIRRISRIRDHLFLRNKRSPIRRLSLENNQIERIEALSLLTNLEWLYLNNNRIERIEGLSTLTNLELLFLNNNQIGKIEGLSTLITLRSLTLDHNQIARIEGLTTLTSLRILFLNNNQIARREGLTTLKNLDFLNLDNNQMEGLSTHTDLLAVLSEF